MFLRDGGARPWQRELTVPVLADALTRADKTPSGQTPVEG
ncbi:hypothetical protein, partial [Mycolicibacterium insubricum]